MNLSPFYQNTASRTFILQPALLYAVKPVPKPFSFYPYGFDKNGNVIYSEYFENAFYELYKGKSGYLYECNNLKNTEKPIQINCAYTCIEAIKIDRVTEISDLYAFYKEQEEKGLFEVKKRADISEREIHFVLDELGKDIEKYDLKNSPQNPMSIFNKAHFPSVWKTDKD